MRVLFFGAGALGTLFAAKLCATGHDVSVLARGERLASLQHGGLRIRARPEKNVETFSPTVVTRVAHEQPYDLAIVLVRRGQVDAALAAIAPDHDGDVLVMVNDARGYAPWRAILDARLVVGFGGAIAVFDADGVLVYDHAPGAVQPTVVGEPDGRTTKRLLRITSLLRETGFPIQVRRDMEAWQRTHAAWIAPFMLSAAIAARDATRLDGPDYAQTWIRATQEALVAVRDAGTPLTPPVFRVVAALSPWVLTGALRVALRARSLRDQVIASGAASSAEGLALVEDLVELAGRPLPSLEALAAQATQASSPSA